ARARSTKGPGTAAESVVRPFDMPPGMADEAQFLGFGDEEDEALLEAPLALAIEAVMNKAQEALQFDDNVYPESALVKWRPTSAGSLADNAPPSLSSPLVPGAVTADVPPAEPRLPFAADFARQYSHEDFPPAEEKPKTQLPLPDDDSMPSPVVVV